MRAMKVSFGRSLLEKASAGRTAAWPDKQQRGSASAGRTAAWPDKQQRGSASEGVRRLRSRRRNFARLRGRAGEAEMVFLLAHVSTARSISLDLFSLGSHDIGHF